MAGLSLAGIMLSVGTSTAGAQAPSSNSDDRLMWQLSSERCQALRAARHKMLAHPKEKAWEIPGRDRPPGMSDAEVRDCVDRWPNNNPAVSGRFTVRPRAMATGTRTERAGEFPLDSLPGYVVYVPPACVGTRRCPLFVFLYGGGYTPGQTLPSLRPMADRYGLIVLVPDSPSQTWDEAQELYNRQHIDAALKQVLAGYAIDPDKIALAGHCAGGASALIWGGDNLDVFSRVVPMSPGYPSPAGVDVPNGTTRFLLDAGYEESTGGVRAAWELEQAGHPVTQVVEFRDHSDQREDYDFVGRWLTDSWAGPAARATPASVPDLVLTTDALAKMTEFWTRFRREPDSIFTAARRAHLRDVAVPVGPRRLVTVMTDIAALASAYPSVAADLEAAGLTAQAHEAVRIALLGAVLAQMTLQEQRDEAANGIDYGLGAIASTSILAKNVAFLDAHPDELTALQGTSMWITP